MCITDWIVALSGVIGAAAAGAAAFFARQAITTWRDQQDDGLASDIVFSAYVMRDYLNAWRNDDFLDATGVERLGKRIALRHNKLLVAGLRAQARWGLDRTHLTNPLRLAMNDLRRAKRLLADSAGLAESEIADARAISYESSSDQPDAFAVRLNEAVSHIESAVGPYRSRGRKR